MAVTTRLSDTQLQELLPLLDDADSVELKLTIPAETHRHALRALDLDPLDAQIRQVRFLDTPDLTVYEHGLVVRLRRIQRKGDDAVVKLRPVAPADLPPELRAREGFSVEVDAMPGGFTCSATLKAVPSADIKRTVDAGRPLRKLFTKEQRRLYASRAPEGLGLDDLTVLGPIFVLKLRFAPRELGRRRMVAELWLYPDESRVLELSTKCPPAETFDVAARTRAYLAGRGVELGGEQETKTRRALQQLSAALVP